MNKIRFYFYRFPLFIASLFCFGFSAYSHYFNPNYDRSKDFLKVQKILQEGKDTVRFYGRFIYEIDFCLWADSAFVFHEYLFAHKSNETDGRIALSRSKTCYKRNQISEYCWELTLIEDIDAQFFRDITFESDVASGTTNDSITITFETPNMNYPLRYIIQSITGEILEAKYLNSRYIIQLPPEGINIAKIYILPKFVNLPDWPSFLRPINNIPISYDFNHHIRENTRIILPNADTEKLLKIKNRKILLFFQENGTMKSDIYPYNYYPSFPIKTR